MAIKFPIYLDHHATTPVDPLVFETMRPYFSEIFGNPASATHSFGWRAEEAVKKAREQVAHLIHAADNEIVWTSGTTESINLALLGAAQAYRDRGNEMITWQTEHKAVLRTMEAVERQGIKVKYLPVNQDGLIDLDDLKKSITKKTILISIIGAHNEIGVLPPLAEIGRIARENGVLFHVDGAQACGKIPIDVETMSIDLLSMSAHKVYGPKGIGALYVRKKSPRVRLTPILYGGGPEGELRPGTLAVPNIVGMGKAFELAESLMTTEAERLLKLRQKLLDGITSKIDDAFLNGDPSRRLPGNLNLSFSGIPAATLMMELKGIALSSGSACTSGSVEPSYVIKALGLGEDRARSSIRFGLGRFTTEEEIDYVIEAVVAAVKKLKRN